MQDRTAVSFLHTVPWVFMVVSRGPCYPMSSWKPESYPPPHSMILSWKIDWKSKSQATLLKYTLVTQLCLLKMCSKISCYDVGTAFIEQFSQYFENCYILIFIMEAVVNC